MSGLSVLVVGAGIAGSTLAYHLGRRGIATTVVELAEFQRTSGSPVDVRGPALTVVEQMDLLKPLQDAATRVTRLVVVDGAGRKIGWIPTQATEHGLEVPRSHLSALLTSAGREYAEFLYNDTVTEMHDDGSGVEVTFERAAPRRFDVIIGADGLHSLIRRLAFGPEEQYVTHLGMYIATTDLGRPTDDPTSVLIYNSPGRAVAIHPTTGREGAAFIFRHPLLAPDAAHNRRQHQQLLMDVYAGSGWRVPDILQRFQESDDVYFDAISRVGLNNWSRGRCVLVGDAASCVSLFGEGSSMAIIGAATLALALSSHPGDLVAAFHRYEQLHRQRLRRHHRGVSITSHLLVPTTGFGIGVRNSAFWMWSAAAAGWSRMQRR